MGNRVYRRVVRWLVALLGVVGVFAIAGSHLPGSLRATTSEAAQRPAVHLAPALLLDPAEPAAGAADLLSVRFGQQDTELQLRLRFASPLKAGGLAPLGGVSACARLLDDRDGGRALCITSGEHSWSKARLAWRGADGTLSDVAGATVVALDDQTFQAFASPRLLGLAEGAHRWVVESTLTGAGCTADPCADRVPAEGTRSMRTGLLVQPHCFGAAARDPLRPCRNGHLRTTVIPSPGDALLLPNWSCHPEPRAEGVPPCGFGLPAAAGRERFALLGDSHAMHWRAAAEVLAQARGWHGVSLARTSCPFTLHPAGRTNHQNAGCARHVRGAIAWLRANPDVQTVVISSHVLPVTPARISDYRTTWRALPPSVTHILVIRDTPAIGAAQAPCVESAMHHHVAAGMRCAQPRADNVRPDPEADATRTAGVDPRVRLLDFTRVFCGATSCPAVIGGALVRKDGEHLTETMSMSLGPQLVRAVERVGI